MSVGYQELQPGLKKRIGLGGGSSPTGNWIIKPIFNRIKLSANASVLNLGFTGFDMDNDTLLIFKNSTFMFPNEYYNVISNTQIQATNGETWEAGDEFNFVALVINDAPTAIKQSSLKNIITITSPKTFIEIGLDFDHTQDTILLFKNGIYQEKEIDYTTDDTYIYPKGMTNFNASVQYPVTFNIVVMRNVIDGAVLVEFDGMYLKDHSVKEIKLDPAILQKAYSYTDKAKNDLLGGAGGAFDTLKELEAALGDDPNFSTTVLTKLANLLSYIGTLTSLTTITKDNLVHAINEVKSDANTANTNIGPMASLPTTNKTNLVESIKEVFQSGVDAKNKVVSAIVTKGGTANSAMTWDDIRNAILAIPVVISGGSTGGGTTESFDSYTMCSSEIVAYGYNDSATTTNRIYDITITIGATAYGTTEPWLTESFTLTPASSTGSAEGVGVRADFNSDGRGVYIYATRQNDGMGSYLNQRISITYRTYQN